MESLKAYKVFTDDKNPSVNCNFTPKASSEARHNQSLLTCEGTVTIDIYKKSIQNFNQEKQMQVFTLKKVGGAKI